METVAEAMRAGRRLFDNHSLVPVGPDNAFSAELKFANVGTIAIGLLKYACDVRIEFGDNASYHIFVPLDGSLDMRIEGSALFADAGTAFIVHPKSSVAVRGWATGTEQVLVLRVDTPSLESELRSLLSRDIVGPIRIEQTLDLQSGPGAQWWHITQAATASLTSSSAVEWNPLFAQSLGRAILGGLLLVANHQFRPELDAAAMALRPPAIARAIEIIEHRAHEPLTVTKIAAEVRLGARSLQVGFRKHVGVTPSEYLTKVRMDRAHGELLIGSPTTTTVSDIASRSGFTHLSRFAAAYRKRFGVTPSQTLRQS